jgi:hypothetical protein
MSRIANKSRSIFWKLQLRPTALWSLVWMEIFLRFFLHLSNNWKGNFCVTLIGIMHNFRVYMLFFTLLYLSVSYMYFMCSFSPSLWAVANKFNLKSRFCRNQVQHIATTRIFKLYRLHIIIDMYVYA